MAFPLFPSGRWSSKQRLLIHHAKRKVSPGPSLLSITTGAISLNTITGLAFNEMKLWAYDHYKGGLLSAHVWLQDHIYFILLCERLHRGVLIKWQLQLIIHKITRYLGFGG